MLFFSWKANRSFVKKPHKHTPLFHKSKMITCYTPCVPQRTCCCGRYDHRRSKDGVWPHQWPLFSLLLQVQICFTELTVSRKKRWIDELISVSPTPEKTFMAITSNFNSFNRFFSCNFSTALSLENDVLFTMGNRTWCTKDIVGLCGAVFVVRVQSLPATSQHNFLTCVIHART